MHHPARSASQRWCSRELACTRQHRDPRGCSHQSSNYHLGYGEDEEGNLDATKGSLPRHVPRRRERRPREDRARRRDGEHATTSSTVPRYTEHRTILMLVPVVKPCRLPICAAVYAEADTSQGKTSILVHGNRRVISRQVEVRPSLTNRWSSRGKTAARKRRR